MVIHVIMVEMVQKASIKDGIKKEFWKMNNILEIDNNRPTTAANEANRHTLDDIYCEIADSVRKVGSFIASNPTVDPENVRGFNKQLVDMISSVNVIGYEEAKLYDAQESLNWCFGQARSEMPVSNSFGTGQGGRVFNSFQAVYESQVE